MERIALVAGLALALAAPAFAQSHPQKTTVSQTTTPTSITTTTTTTTVIDTDVDTPLAVTRSSHVVVDRGGPVEPPALVHAMETLVVEPMRPVATTVVTTY